MSMALRHTRRRNRNAFANRTQRTRHCPLHSIRSHRNFSTVVTDGTNYFQPSRTRTPDAVLETTHVTIKSAIPPRHADIRPAHGCAFALDWSQSGVNRRQCGADARRSGADWGQSGRDGSRCGADARWSGGDWSRSGAHRRLFMPDAPAPPEEGNAGGLQPEEGEDKRQIKAIARRVVTLPFWAR